MTGRDYYQRGLWRDDTLYSLMAAHAGARPRAFALRDGARRLSWAELARWTDAVAADFHAAGLVPGARVSLWMSNRVEAVVALLACARNGYVCNPSLHRNYSDAEVRARLDQLSAQALLVEDGFGEAAAPSLRKTYRLRAGHDPGPDLPGPDAAPGDLPARATDPDAVFYIAFTSGTTGAPKGVMHSANTLLANARDLVADWGHGPDTVLLSLSPLSHHIAWVALAQALVGGCELVINDPPPSATSLDWIVETGASYVMGVPTHAIDVLAEQKARGLSRLGKVSVFYMAGSPIPPATAQAFVDQGIKPQNVYGMTENSSHQYTHPDDDTATITATCGRGGPAYEVRLFKQDDRDIAAAPGEVGEIGGRGAALTLGYFDDKAATQAAFNRDGWFMSGDLGRLDEAGCLSIVGRLKDLIIRGGRNIHPARIENLAMGHPAVEKAAAFAVPDERLGEKVCLAILPSGPAPDAQDVLTHLHHAGLSITDMPEYFIAMPEFPLTASGKILKRDLAARARDGTLAPTPVRFTEPSRGPA